MIEEQIKEMIDTNDVILFMKGDPHQPKCGFSERVVEVLIEIGKPFSNVDVLDSPNIRANLPKISEWPTFPQLFIKGDLVVGCDIITEMHHNDELSPMFP